MKGIRAELIMIGMVGLVVGAFTFFAGHFLTGLGIIGASAAIMTGALIGRGKKH